MLKCIYKFYTAQCDLSWLAQPQIVDESDSEEVENFNHRKNWKAEQKSKQSSDIWEQTGSPESCVPLESNKLIVYEIYRQRRSGNIGHVLVFNVLIENFIVVVDRIAGWQTFASFKSLALLVNKR